MITCFDHRELSALQGLPWRTQLVYMHGIKPYMDSATGIVGHRRGISYQSISECLFVEPAQRRERYVKPSIKELRVSVGQLIEAGIIEVIPSTRRLVFRCVLAIEHKSVQKLKGRERADQGQTNRGRADAAGGVGLSGNKGSVYPQGESANKGIPLKSNKTYNSVVAVVSNLPRAHVDRTELVNALAAACDDSGCSIFRPERIHTPRVQTMIDDWVRSGVKAKAVSQTIAMVLARGVRLNSPAYLADAVKDFADEQSGAADKRRAVYTLPQDDDALSRWAAQHGYPAATRIELSRDYRSRLKKEIADRLRRVN